MEFRKHKYALSGLVIAVVFWFFDSVIHYIFYGETEFEIIPSDFNELWMRSAIILLVMGGGIYVDKAVNLTKQLQEEQIRLHLKLEDAMTKLLSGFISICSGCKKVKIGEEKQGKEEIWENIESYISHHSNMTFSHGYCPDCSARFSSEIDERIRERNTKKILEPQEPSQSESSFHKD